jgi:hypothetical protein
MPDIPEATDFDITTGTTSDAVRQVLDAKYTDAGAWATWAATMLQTDIADINNLLATDKVTQYLEALSAAIDTLPEFIAGTISGGVADFTNSALVALQSRLATDIATYSTGLGTAEAALFARETARQNAARSAAYTEITTQFSSRGYDLPPGALTAKQTEVNNESGIRLTDSSTAIMAESARLAVDYNKSVIAGAIQLQDILSRVFDSKEMRLFEASKASVMYEAEVFKVTLARYSTQGELALKQAEIVIQAQARQLALEVSTLLGLAQSASQMVAAALNGVSVSTSLDYGASTSMGRGDNKTTSLAYTATPGVMPPTV